MTRTGITRTPARPRRGFTLIELMIVILIIGLLVAILLPALVSAMRMAEAAKSQVRIGELSDAALQYNQEYGSFPGQLGLGGLTGSQKLALDLFGPDLMTPKTLFAGCRLSPTPRKSDLFNPAEIDGDYGDAANSLSDRYGTKPMAILYYPSNRAATDLTQYTVGDNAAYLSVETDPQNIRNGGTPWNNYIKDPTAAAGSNKPYKTGQFLMIGAGIDRQYFTPDDLTNF